MNDHPENEPLPLFAEAMVGLLILVVMTALWWLL